MTKQPITREPMRDPAARAAEIRESNAHIEEVQNKYDIDPSIIPPGWTYEWKRLTVMNAEDPGHMQELYRKGWEEVPASRHPEMMPFGYGESNTIVRDGQVLMERPEEITKEAREAKLRAARNQRIQKEQQLTSGGPEGIDPNFDANPQNMKQKIGSRFEALPVPDK